MKIIGASVVYLVLLCGSSFASSFPFSLSWNEGSGNVWSTKAVISGDTASLTGTFANASGAVLCHNALCTSFTTDINVSGLTATNLIFNNTLYPNIYFSGSLDITTNFRKTTKFGLTSAHTVMAGTLIACSDPACSTELFTVSIDAGSPIVEHPNLVFGVNSAGQPIVTAASFNTITPEPGTFVLVGSGCAFLLGFLRRPSQK